MPIKSSFASGPGARQKVRYAPTKGSLSSFFTLGKIRSKGLSTGGINPCGVTQARFLPDRVLCDATRRRNRIRERHADSVLRPQNDHRTSFDRLARSQLEIIFSEQIAQNHKDLQHRVISTDAAARSAPEGKEGEGRAQLVVRFAETLRIEILRILPVARSMVRTVHIHNDGRSTRYGELAYAIVRDSHAVDHPKWRVEAQPLANDLSRKFKLGDVGVAQRRFAEHRIKFLPYPFQAIRSRTQKIKKPR